MATTTQSCEVPPSQRPAKPMTPPTSEEGDKPKPESVQSELSDLELDEDDDEGEIEPDHYYENGRIPVFKPTMDQFRSFKKFIAKIDHHGMKSGIVKVIPPKEWIDSLPALDQAVKTIKVKNPITQEFSGMHGTFTQANIEKQRSYNLPQWKDLTEEPQYQPPARRGERRRNHDKVTRPQSAKAKATDPSEPPRKKLKPGRKPKKGPKSKAAQVKDEESDGGSDNETAVQVPPTPVSPATLPAARGRGRPKSNNTAPKSKGRQPKTVAERRKYNRQDVDENIDEEAFENFDYRFPEQEEFTAERCQELENLYWKSLTFAPPMYGADMPGSLFNDNTTSWNVAHLENLLDVLGQKIPGVNTAYLYLGMWKATYAWHLEDVDLYSINYIHFGAPKQWYSISQEDARKFEAAMRDVWPTDAKNCSQFLRHKTYLISPSLLESKYKIKVNRLVHYEGEFVITFPYGYHSGYNLGYNCAESVNFATESWLDYGRIAKKCDCEADSVWVDVGEIERKLRGEPTPEYYEETEDEGDYDEPTDLPSPPASVTGKGNKKRKRGPATAAAPRKVKKIKIRLKTSTYEPCVLCPNDMPSLKLLDTHTGLHAHELCAQYTKETTVEEDESGDRVVHGIKSIDKARLELKCNFCRSKKGACFQCSERKCFRAFHATCAAAAGVSVNYGPTPVLYMPDGTEYYQEQYDFRCRFHRSKRPKTVKSESLEDHPIIRKFMKNCRKGDVIQMQYYQGDIFAGTIIDKRSSEGTVLVKVLPEGDEVEVEYKWVLAPDLEDSKQPKPSGHAKPLPLELLNKSEESSSHALGPPQPDDHFTDNCKWAEFVSEAIPLNPAQVKIDLAKQNQIWHYLGKSSTEVKAQFTEDPNKKKHNPAANFLETVRPTPRYVPPVPKKPLPAAYPTGTNYHALNGAMAQSRQSNQHVPGRAYEYKPKVPMSPGLQNGSRPSISSPDSSVDPMAYQQNTAVNYLPPYSSAPGNERRWSAQSPSTDRPLSSHGPNLSQKTGPNKGNLIHTQPLRRTPSSSLQSTPVPNHKPLATPDWRAPRGGSFSSAQQPMQRAAPMANMMAPKIEPQGPSMPAQVSGDLNYLERIQKYPYLRNAFLRRPSVYKSPYPNETEYSPDYAPLVADGPAPPIQHQPNPQQSPWHPSALGPQQFPTPYTRPVPQNFYPSSISAHMPYQQPPMYHHQHMHYQTPDQFQEQVKREAASTPRTDQLDGGIDRLMSHMRGPATPMSGVDMAIMQAQSQGRSVNMSMRPGSAGGMAGPAFGGSRGQQQGDRNTLFANPP